MACAAYCLVVSYNLGLQWGMGTGQDTSRSCRAIPASRGYHRAYTMRKSRVPGNTEGLHDVEPSRRQALPQALHYEVRAFRGQACMASAPSLGCERRPRTGEEHLGTHDVQDSACSKQGSSSTERPCDAH